ncbi:MAG TPA: DNA recombination protein RmuC [Calditrichaeota bacterium]|nr:DNA recombination protein RmuC [Calditrichota bacterium]
MNDIFFFTAGLFVGGLAVFLIMLRQQKTIKRMTEELLQKSMEDRINEYERLLAQLRDSFGSLSMEALSKNTDEFLKLAKEAFSNQSQMNAKTLDSKKELIDLSLKNMKNELNKVQEIIQQVEKERKQSFGSLSEQLKSSAEQTRQLREVTNQLTMALSSSQIRGQWGERMAEDVLRLAGFMEGINYLKQTSGANTSDRPDFTFLLPHNLKVNMDVKFPFSNYLAYLNAESESDKARYKTAFLRDVRQRIKEVHSRNYINPADNTVDYVIVFIPNEQVYAFINENDSGILDEALRNKVILSSPITLYAILAVIRQAVDNFNLEHTAAQILSLLGEFNKQWEKFKGTMDKMGQKLDDAQKEFQHLVTTRTRQLERPLVKLENLRTPDGNLLKSAPADET